MKPAKKKVFDNILYSQCWEDPSLDRAAFKIASHDTVFSITSGGCNVLTFLIDNPQKVIALDINPYQNFLLELKIAAFKSLTYEGLLEFVGVRSSQRRLQLYVGLRLLLGPAALAYWDHEGMKIQNGIIHCGRYERYMALLRRWLHWLMGKPLIEKFYQTDDPTCRAALYDSEWDNVWWKLFTHALLSRTTMSLLFDKAFFKYLDESFSFGRHFAERTRKALTTLPMKENYFLSYILLGNFYSEDSLPPYLRRGNFKTIRNNLHKIEVVNDSCEHFFSLLPESSISKFNFTNIFEWMSPENYEKLLRETYRVAKAGAVLTYRNLLVHRERPTSLAHYLESLKDQARALHERDLSFIYSNYVIERITKRSEQCITKSAWNATVERGKIFSASHT